MTKKGTFVLRRKNIINNKTWIRKVNRIILDFQVKTTSYWWANICSEPLAKMHCDATHANKPQRGNKIAGDRKMLQFLASLVFLTLCETILTCPPDRGQTLETRKKLKKMSSSDSTVPLFHNTQSSQKAEGHARGGGSQAAAHTQRCSFNEF